MINTIVRVVNEHNQDVKQDGIEIGEIIVKGPGVLEDNRWLHTGDMGTIDEKGQVNIVERKKDIILNGKHAISSIEIENVFNEHPAVQEVAIILTPDKKLGEVLHAIVVLHDSHVITKEELLQYSNENLDEFKCPNKVTFMDELPKTPSGKIQKIQLSELV